MQSSILTFQTKGNTDIIDITGEVIECAKKSKVMDGIASLFVKGSTASLTTIEADENLYQDLKEVLDKLIPMNKDWKHHRTWGDLNGGSHLRASIIGPSLNIPIKNNRLVLGTWQKIVLIDFDTLPRTREVFVNCFDN